MSKRDWMQIFGCGLNGRKKGKGLRGAFVRTDSAPTFDESPLPTKSTLLTPEEHLPGSHQEAARLASDAAEAAEAAGDTSAALEHYYRAIECQPECQRFLLKAGNIERGLGSTARAIALYDRCMAIAVVAPSEQHSVIVASATAQANAAMARAAAAMKVAAEAATEAAEAAAAAAGFADDEAVEVAMAPTSEIEMAELSFEDKIDAMRAHVPKRSSQEIRKSLHDNGEDVAATLAQLR